MKPDKNKDITKHIAEMLKEHSLPYEEGAWERFKDFEATRKKRVVLWPYFTGAAAAVVLLAISLFLVTGDNKNENQQIVRQEVANNNIIDTPDNDLIDSNELINSESLVSTSDQPNLVAALNKRQIESAIVSDDLSGSNSLDIDQRDLNRTDLSSPLLYQNDTSRYKEAQSIASTEPITSSNVALTPKEIYTSPHTGSEPLDQNVVNIADNKKWDFSVELSPNIKDKDVNFGGGFAVAYNLSDKISIGSGVSYMQLDAQRAPNRIDIPAEFSTLDGSKNKSLNTISTSLAGLDIPINLKMNVGNAMYVNAGVSVFSVLNESRYNNFEERIAVTALASPAFSSSDDKREKTGVESRTLYSQEVNTSTPYEGKNFTGFFNFSVGYKLPFLLPKMNLAIEPYFKIPIGSLSDQDMDLNNGGFKIKASF